MFNKITHLLNQKNKSMNSNKSQEGMKIEFEELFARYISKDKSSNLCNDSLHVCMRPKKIENVPPVCLICVVDVSGSMSSNCAGNVENMESVYISRLELVKHSLKTIVSTLRTGDMISIIRFDDKANFQVKPIVLKNKNTRETVINDLDKMNTGGCTNMWAGIKMAIDASASIPINNYQKSIMVFTDGASNVNPSKGIYQTLKETLDVCKDKFTISTFSFGNGIRPELLRDIANLGNGIYGYCPDGTMVGTIFINYMANILSTITSVIKIEVDQGEGEQKVQKRIIGPLYRGAYRNAIFEINSKLLNETKVTIELPMLNQVVDVPLNTESLDLDKYINDMSEFENRQRKTNRNANNNNENENDDDDDDDDDDELLDEESDDETIKMEDIDPDAPILETDFKSVQYEEILLNQIIRNKFINDLNEIFKITDSRYNNYEQEEVKNILTRCIELLNQLNYKTKFIKNLLIDIDNPDPNHGQVMKAISQQYIFSWGICYLCSFLRFHQFEQCGNFKDQSLQCYSNEVFNVLRKMANTIFINLPPPKSEVRTTRRYYSSNSIINSVNSSSLRSSNSSGFRSSNNISFNNVQMSNFINRHGGCFNGEAIVLLANGKSKCVKDLKKGDRLKNNAIVQCLIEQRSNNLSKPYMCIIDGILFTPYHPICKEDQWYFPIDLVQSKPVAINSWFNLILNDDIHSKYEVEFENGIKAITLGHYRKENKILDHPYFGTDLVLKDLKERDPYGYVNGYIYIEDINYHQLKYDNNQCCINYYKIQSNNYNNDNDNNKIMKTENKISELVY